MQIRDLAAQTLGTIRAHGTLRSLRQLSNLEGPRVEVDGKPVWLFAGSNYLDLGQHPKVVEAAARAARDWGCNSGGSRLISGNLELHEAFEAELAAWQGSEAALLFNSGYGANTGLLPALVGPADLVVSDSLNHASIIDGAKLSGAQVQIFPHRDCEALANVFAQHGSRARHRLLVVDGVFSMEGDIAPIAEICAVAREHDAWVLLDDAHGTATLGPDGRGVAAHCGVADEVDIYVGNLAKALGSFGAFVSGSAALRDLLINTARSFIFSCALPPTQVAAARAALEVSREESWRREALQRNAARLRDGLAAAGISSEASSTQIVPVVLGDNETTMRVCEALLEHGFYVQGIRHPSVPRGTARLRITPMATHRDAEIDALVEAVVELVAAESRSTPSARSARAQNGERWLGDSS